MAKAKLTPFQQSIKDAERRAHRKVRRLENKGINTNAIKPQYVSMETLTTGQRRAYKNQLEKFISRSTRYHAGAEGAPISHQVVQQIKQAEKISNKIRAARWGSVKDKRVLEPGSTMTTEQYRDVLDLHDPTTGKSKPNPRSPMYFTHEKHHDTFTFKSEQAAREYVKKIKSSSTKKHYTEADRRLRTNAAKAATNLNDVGLAKRIKKLSVQELYELTTRLDFIQVLFTVGSDPSATEGEVAGAVSHLNRLVDRVSGVERLRHPLEFDAVGG